MTIEIESVQGPFWWRYGILIGLLLLLGLPSLFSESDGREQGFQVMTLGMALAIALIAFAYRPKKLSLKWEGNQFSISRKNKLYSVEKEEFKAIDLMPMGNVLGQSLDWVIVSTSKGARRFGPCLVSSERREEISKAFDQMAKAIAGA